MKRFVRKRWGFLTIILLLTAATTTILPLPAAETSPTTNNISPDATVSTNDTTMSPEEMVQLGEDFYFGRWRDDQAGTPDNITEAARWFRRAAEMGNARGQCRLGMYYCHSTGWSSSLDAEKWFISAAAAGDPEAQAWLGNMYVERKQFEEAFVWLRRSADQESPFGMLLLGLCYQKGDGVETDPVRGKELCDTAIESIRECAELGDVEAMDRLGICYANGQGTEMDLVLGRKWFRSAVRIGNTRATDLGWFTEQALTSSRSGEFESMSDWNAIWNGNTPRRTTIATSNHRGTGNATIGTTNTVTIGGVPEWNWNENGDENENTSGVLR